MLAEIQDPDAIVSSAIAIASEEKRDAYIAWICGDDAALRRRVQERVAAHFQAGNAEKPAIVAAHGSLPSGRDRTQADANHVEARKELAGTMSPVWKRPRGLAIVAALLLLAAFGVGGGLTVWALRAERQAQAIVQQATEERDHARKAEAEVKDQRDKSEAARQAVAKEREQALAEEKIAQRAEEDAKAALAFFKDKLLATARPKGLAGGQGKDITLRQAVDAAESQVAETFADRPLAEASIRETLGSTYLDLEEAARAVKQYERALALREAMQGENHPDTVACRNQLAVAYRLAGRTTDASSLYEQNPDSSSHAAALAVQGLMLLSQKNPLEAGAKLRECLAIRQKIQPDDWTTFDAKLMLGEALLDQKRYADAEPLLLSGYEGLKQHKAKIPAQAKVRLTKSLERLVQLYEAQDKKDKAAEWRKELQTAQAAKEP